MSSSEKQKESIIRAELKRCMSIERRWNTNEVSRESPDKEVNRRPTSLKKFSADALRGPRVSIATGWNINYYYIIIIIILAHQHKAAGMKSRLDIQNYGCNGNLLLLLLLL